MYPNTTIPDPLDFVLPKWHSDPLFRGSYSNMPTPYLPIHQENLRAVVNDTLWFAGEATSQRYYGKYKHSHPDQYHGLNWISSL